MRFECPNCSTVYDVPDDKVGRTAKLKCSVCGDIWKIAVPKQSEDVVSPEEEFAKAVDSFEAAPFEGENPFAQDVSAEEDVPSEEEIPDEDAAPEEEDVSPDEGATSGYSQFVPPPPEEEPVNIEDLNAFFDYAPNMEAARAAERKRRTVLLGATGVFLFFAAIVLMLFAPEKDLPASFENVRYFFSEEEYKHFLNVEGAIVNKASVPAVVGGFSVRFFNKSGVNIANQTMQAVLPVLKPAEPVPFALKIERPPSTAQKIELVLKKVRPAPADSPEKKKTEN